MPSLRLALLVVLCVSGTAVETAEARRSQSFNYPFSRVWASSVRLLRVDYNSAITEKDKENGYFLFEFEHEGRAHPGSVELVRVSEKGLPEIQVVIQVPAMPSYVEQMLLDRLERKLEEEYGQPREDKPPPQKPDQKPKQGDADKDGDEKKRAEDEKKREKSAPPAR